MENVFGALHVIVDVRDRVQLVLRPFLNDGAANAVAPDVCDGSESIEKPVDCPEIGNGAVAWERFSVAIGTLIKALIQATLIHSTLISE